MSTIVKQLPPPYTAGTISGAAGSAVVTGTSTAWISSDGNGNQVANIFPGDILIVPAINYFGPIQSIDTELQLTLELPLTTAIPAGSSYRVRRYTPLPTGALLGALQDALAKGSDAHPNLSETIDGGTGRLKLRALASGGAELAVGPTGAADAALVSAIKIGPDGKVTFAAGLDTLAAGAATFGSFTANAGAFLASPTVPTPAAGDVSTKAASTAFVEAFFAGATRGFTNRVLNGNFAVNQRGYASGGTLATGAFGHDRWKLVTSGGNGSYTFTQATKGNNLAAHSIDSLVAVPAAYKLSQTLDADDIEGGTYTLSWTGTATGSVSCYNGSASVVLVTGASPLSVNLPTGVTPTIAFQNGTLGNVQMEQGPYQTPFERRPLALEHLLCQRFYYQPDITPGTLYGTMLANAQTYRLVTICFPIRMRATPTCTLTAVSSSGAWSSGYPGAFATRDLAAIRLDTAGAADYAHLLTFTASAEL